MKVLFIGLGSIGRRHSRLIHENFGYKIFALRSGNTPRNTIDYVVDLQSWDDVLDIKPNVAFITNPTSIHIKTALKCAEYGINLFIEKPLDSQIEGLDNLLNIVKISNITTYVAYNLRFHPIIKYIKQLTELNNPLHFRAYCSSYLPDWRPNVNYKKSYSSIKALGGGVMLDLSHELDYATYLLGSPLSINSKSGRISDLTVDSDDYADILISGSNGNCEGNIHLNYFGHSTERKVIIDFREFSVVGDLINNTVVRFERGNIVESQQYDIDRDYTYTEQLKYYFSNINNQRMQNNIFEASILFRKLVNC